MCLPPHIVQEGALEILVVLTAHGGRRFKQRLLAERPLLPKLIRLMAPSREERPDGRGGAADGRGPGGRGKERESEPGVNLQRRAAQILLNLCDCGPEAHAALRMHEGTLMHLAMHDLGGASQHAGELLELLCER